MRTALRQLSVPAPLALLLAVGTILMLAWSIGQPPWQGPDEAGHFQYVQRVVEQREIPWYLRGNCEDCRHGPSTEQEAAQKRGGYLALQGNPAMKEAVSPADELAWAEFERGLEARHRGDVKHNATFRNPPAYYLYESVPYVAASGGDIFDRLFLMRLANIPLVLTLIGCAWILTGLIVGPRRWLQALAAGVVALNAQLYSVSGAVNADALLSAAFGVATVLMALILLRGPTRGRVLGLLAAGAVAALSHPRGLPVVAPVLLTLGIAWWRVRAPHTDRARRGVRAALLAAVPLAALAVTFVATNGALSATRVREWASYLWQVYLPRLPSMTPSPRSDWTWRDIFVDRMWGIFTQFDVIVAPWILDLMAVLTVLGVVALVAVLLVRFATVRRVGAVAVVLALAVVAYVGALHVSAFRTLSDGGDDPMLTGRYMLPFLPLLGLALAVMISWMPRRASGAVAGLLLTGALALHFAALGALLTRFHL